MQVRDIMVMFLSVIGLLHNAKKIMLPWYASAEPLECDDDDLSRSCLRNFTLSSSLHFRDIFRCRLMLTKREYKCPISMFYLVRGKSCLLACIVATRASRRRTGVY
jgi:hypothetical protein